MSSNLKELTPYFNFATTYAFHPVDAVAVAAPALNVFNILGGVSFKPQNITNLSEKVVLVTGGKLRRPKGNLSADSIIRKRRSWLRDYLAACPTQSIPYLSCRTE